MYKIGLTGGIGSGKSYVLSLLREAGCFTLRADEIAKKIIFDGNEEINAGIKEIFGDIIFKEDGKIDKQIFSDLFFKYDNKRTTLNSLIHPLVAQETDKMFKEIEQTGVYKIFVYESALLLEAGIHKEFDKIIVVYTTEETRLARVMERDGISEEKAKRIIRTQFPLEEKLKIANYTIDTSGDFCSTKIKTFEALHLMKKDLKVD